MPPIGVIFIAPHLNNWAKLSHWVMEILSIKFWTYTKTLDPQKYRLSRGTSVIIIIIEKFRCSNI